MKRIAICGISGSGKTTLMKELAKNLALPIVTNSIIDLAKTHQYWLTNHEKLLAFSRTHPREAKYLQLEFLKQRIESFKRGDIFISDRSTIDNWVYYQIQNLPFSVVPNTDMGFYETYISSLTLYTHIIFLDTEEPIALDNKRVDNPLMYRLTNNLFRLEIDFIQNIRMLPGLKIIRFPQYQKRTLSESVDALLPILNE